jgi:hypothetical protein
MGLEMHTFQMKLLSPIFVGLMLSFLTLILNRNHLSIEATEVIYKHQC